MRMYSVPAVHAVGSARLPPVGSIAASAASAALRALSATCVLATSSWVAHHCLEEGVGGVSDVRVYADTHSSIP
jgi:hypothetical protein